MEYYQILPCLYLGKSDSIYFHDVLDIDFAIRCNLPESDNYFKCNQIKLNFSYIVDVDNIQLREKFVKKIGLILLNMGIAIANKQKILVYGCDSMQLSGAVVLLYLILMNYWSLNQIKVLTPDEFTHRKYTISLMYLKNKCPEIFNNHIHMHYKNLILYMIIRNCRVPLTHECI